MCSQLEIRTGSWVRSIPNTHPQDLSSLEPFSPILNSKKQGRKKEKQTNKGGREGITGKYQGQRASHVAQLVKNLTAMRKTWVRPPGWEDPLEKGKATHSSILPWRIPLGCKELDMTEQLSLSPGTRTGFQGPKTQFGEGGSLKT